MSTIKRAVPVTQFKCLTRANLDLPSPIMPDPITVFSSDTLRCVCFNHKAEHLVVSLDFRRIRDGSFPKPDFPQRLHDRAYLLIHCKTNNWFLSPDTKAMRKALRAFCTGFATVNALGSSMGGYGGLLLAEELQASQLLLVSPQASIFPDVAPYEKRFAEFAKDLDPALDTALATNPKFCRGLVIYDPSVPEDRKHKNLICRCFPELQGVALGFAGHPAMRLITQAHLFGKALAELKRPKLRASHFRNLHRTVRRESADYSEKLQRYLAMRAARGP